MVANYLGTRPPLTIHSLTCHYQPRTKDSPDVLIGLLIVRDPLDLG